MKIGLQNLMKIKSIRRILVLILILTSLVFFFPWGGPPTAPGARASNLQPSHTLDVESHRSRQKAVVHALPQQYMAHEPIRIMKNADIAAFGFPGDGTPSNPYVIEGLNITSACQTLIHIQETTAYFCIRNNLLNGLTGEHNGIYLLGLQQQRSINSNIISNCKNGIYLEDCHHETTITNNIISNCGWAGIHGGSTITHNTISNCGMEGIHLEDSRGSIITHNTISNCGENGILLRLSHGSTIDYNTISNCGENGILPWYSGGSTIDYNTISNCGWAGIHLFHSRIPTFVGNRLINNGLIVGISVGLELGPVEPYFFLGTVADNLVNDRPLVYWENVRGGTVPPGAGQVILINTTGVEVTGQNLSRASRSLFAALSSNLNIHHNTLSGIHLQWSKNNTIVHNIISQNTGIGGIYLVRSRENIVSNNTISHNSNGIYLQSSEQNFVSNNTISQNSDGIKLFGSCSEKNTVTHNTVSQNSNGIVLVGSAQNTVVHNTVSQNTDTGIILTDSARQNTVAHNIVSYNRGYGVWLRDPPSSHSPSKDNTVKENDFLGNNPRGSSQACDDGQLNVFTRNYWADHENTDWNGDGIADTPYPIDGDAYHSNQDPSPLTSPFNPDYLHRHLLSIPTIQYPNGGETLRSTIRIEWAGALDSLGHPVTYTVTYSPDNGNTWIPLASGLSTTSYEWDTTTVANGAAYRIQVLATCSDGLSTEDRSDAPFSIRNIAHRLSAPTILSPNGGETLQGTVMLSWMPTNDSWGHSVTYTVWYSMDDEHPWILLASGLTHPCYEWNTITVKNGFSYQIKVVATCSDSLTSEDYSDALFVIQNPATTTTSSPATTTTSSPATTTTSLTSVESLPIPNGAVGILLVTLLLTTIPLRRVKRKTR